MAAEQIKPEAIPGRAVPDPAPHRGRSGRFCRRGTGQAGESNRIGQPTRPSVGKVVVSPSQSDVRYLGNIAHSTGSLRHRSVDLQAGADPGSSIIKVPLDTRRKPSKYHRRTSASLLAHPRHTVPRTIPFKSQNTGISPCPPTNLLPHFSGYGISASSSRWSRVELPSLITRKRISFQLRSLHEARATS